MGARKTVTMLAIPVELPADTSSVNIDYDQQGESGKEIIITFIKDDGTRVQKKGNLPALSETGVTLTIS